MNFRNDSLDGWMQHSPHLQLNNKSIRFAQAEYTRVYSDAAKSAKFEDTGENDISGRRNKKATSVPKRIQEHYAVAEFCLINKLTVETPGRKYNQDEIWKSLSEITTKLELETNKEKSRRWTNQVMSEEERALSTITDNIFSNRDSSNSDSASTVNASNDESNEESVTVGFDEIGIGGVEEEPDESNEQRDALSTVVDDPTMSESNTSNGDSSEENAPMNEIEVRIGKKGKGEKVRRAKVNELVLVDVFTVTMEKLIKLDLPISRHRKKLCMEREQRLKKRLLEEIKSSEQASG